MSSRILGQVLEHYPGMGMEFTLAIILADEADHSGGHIHTGTAELARLSRQSENNVRRLLKKMEEGGWLECLERSSGGRGKATLYRINPEWVQLPMGWNPKPSNPPNPPNGLGVCEGPKPPNDLGVSGAAHSSLKTLPPVVPQFELEPDTGNGGQTELDAADLRAAQWMLDRLRSLNPNHRAPKRWKRWTDEIRALRTEVPGLTHRRICEVFKWANEDRTPRPGSDFCWAKQILSPGNLRTQWDRLVLQADKFVKAPAAHGDGLCETCQKNPSTIQMGNGPRQCRQCFDIAERTPA